MSDQIIQKQQVLASTLSAKAKSKQEIYVLLCIEARVYLPKVHHITIYFLKDLISGQRKAIKNNNVQVIYVPQYDNLSVECILQFLGAHSECFLYFPQERKEILRLPKQWIVNVAATVIGKPFREWVAIKINDRNRSLAVQKNLFVDMDPDIYHAFQNSTAVSTMKGSGANLCKAESKRRRTKAEVAAEKLLHSNADQAMKAKQKEIEELQATLDNFSDQNPDMINRVGFISELMDSGIVRQNPDGTYQLNQGSQ